MQAYRAQADSALYSDYMRKKVLDTEHLTVLEGMAKELLQKGGKVAGVITTGGERYMAQSVIVSTGTFLNGLIHIGLDKTPAGRRGDPPAVGLTESLKELGFSVGRLKTGTCPRLDRTTIDFSKAEEQPGDNPPHKFSFWSDGISQPQVSCHIVQTTEETQRVIEDNLDRSPLFTGVIKGVGPRYCPSIEDKVKRFPDKRKHHIFLEPGRSCHKQNISKRSFHFIAGRYTGTIPANHTGAGKGRDRTSWLRDRIRFLPPHTTKTDVGNKGCRGAVLRRPDQRNVRI